MNLSYPTIIESAFSKISLSILPEEIQANITMRRVNLWQMITPLTTGKVIA